MSDWYDEPKYTKLNDAISIKTVNCHDSYDDWVEEELVRADGNHFLSPYVDYISAKGDYIYNDDFIIFYKIKESYDNKKEVLVITNILDLKKFKVKTLSLKEQLALFKLIYFSQTQPEDIDIIGVVEPPPTRRKIFFDLY